VLFVYLWVQILALQKYVQTDEAAD
jgi:hypothetical protein